jgi:hypothetical protein
VADDDGKDEAVIIGEDVVAVDIAPLVAGGRAAEVMGVPVFDPLTAIPVVVIQAVTFFPVVVVDIVMVIVVVAVVVVLGEGEGTGEGDGEGGDSKNSANKIHG